MPLDLPAVNAVPQAWSAPGLLRVNCIADDQSRFLGALTGARCELPTGEAIEVKHQRTPLFDLARALAERGYGD